MRLRSVTLKVVVCLIGLACTPALSHAEDWSLDSLTKRTSVWPGFGVDTMIHHRTATELQIHRRTNAARKTTAETRMTLIGLKTTTAAAKARK